MMIELSEPLKPCPICGGPFAISQEDHENHPVAGMFYIYHTDRTTETYRKCPLEIRGHFGSREEALSCWNDRHVPDERIILPKIKVAEFCYSMGWSAGYGQALVERGICMPESWDLEKPKAVAALQAGGEDPGEDAP